MASLSLKNVTKIYRREVRAVENFNLDIDDKEFVVLCGPSGSGKSAILRMIAGLDNVSSGEIYMDSRRIDMVPAKERDVAIVSHDRALNSFQNIHKNIQAGLKGLGLSAAEAEQRVKEAAELLDLTQLLDRKPKTLSEGQKQRVLLARAIARRPKVLLLDNPLSDLDLRTRSRLRTRIGMLHKQLQQLTHQANTQLKSTAKNRIFRICFARATF